MAGFEMKMQHFEDLQPYLNDDEITEITWNGRALYVDHLKKGRYKTDLKLDESFVEGLSAKVANYAVAKFNYSEPELCVETDDLRISIFHPSITNGYHSLDIRKTPAIRRLNFNKIIDEKYASVDVLLTLIALVKADCSVVVLGEPASGKTELLKFSASFIPDSQRTITIEDTFELRLDKLNPNLDVVSVKVDDIRFTYSDAIVASLRHRPHNLFVSEVRGKDAYYLLEAASTGCRVMSTAHGDSVENFPSRMIQMMGSQGEEKRNDIYSFIDVVIKLKVEETKNGIYRAIEQVAFLDRQKEQNIMKIFYDDGVLDYSVFDELPKLQKKFKRNHIKIPTKLSQTEIDEFLIKIRKVYKNQQMKDDYKKIISEEAL